MRGIVTRLMNFIDSAMYTYLEAVFRLVANPLIYTMKLAGILCVILIALNSIFKFKQFSMEEYINWALKYGVIIAFLSVWSNFRLIYDFFSDAPNQYAGGIVNAAISSSTNFTGTLYEHIDRLAYTVYEIGEEVISDSGKFDFGGKITGVIILIIGFFLQLYCMFVAGAAKMGLGMAIGISPIFICMKIFKITDQFFDSWLKFTLSFAFVPIVLSGIIALVIAISYELRKGIGVIEGAGNDLEQYLVFLICIVIATFLVGQVPTMVQSISGTFASVAGGSMLQSAKNAGSNAMSAGGNYAKGLASSAAGAVSQAIADKTSEPDGDSGSNSGEGGESSGEQAGGGRHSNFNSNADARQQLRAAKKRAQSGGAGNINQSHQPQNNGNSNSFLTAGSNTKTKENEFSGALNSLKKAQDTLKKMERSEGQTRLHILNGSLMSKN